MNLTLLDYLIIGIPLALVLAVGVIMRRYTHSVADYLAANRCAGRYLLTTSAEQIGGGGEEVTPGTAVGGQVIGHTVGIATHDDTHRQHQRQRDADDQIIEEG